MVSKLWIENPSFSFFRSCHNKFLFFFFLLSFDMVSSFLFSLGLKPLFLLSASEMENSLIQSSESPQNLLLAPAPLQTLNHPLPIKLDRNNYILWETQIENVVFANDFEDFIDGVKQCPLKELFSGEINLEFVQWRHLDRTILNWLYSTLTYHIMSQIVGYQKSHEAWITLQRIFSSSSKARIMQLILEFQTIKKGGESMIEYILKLKTVSNNLVAVGESVKETS